MLTRIEFLICTLLVCSAASVALGQTSFTEFQQALQQKAAFEQRDFAAVQMNQPVVRLSRTSDKREVALAGVVNIHASADDFLKSYLENMTRKHNAAILEIGSFGAKPTLADLTDLTMETRDIEDLKECIVGECQVKLSAPMIERFRREIDWQSPGYQLSVTNLFKQMLLEYVQAYKTHGEAALIAYNDKRDEVSVAKEHRAIAAASSYIGEALADRESGLRLIEDALVWSKIKIGAKPVVIINHIKIYRRNAEVGPQVLIESNQIYANHYLHASRALTAFVKVPDTSQGGYLVYENRSIADGLQGPFGKIKRGVVEKKVVAALKGMLQHSKASLEGQRFNATAAEFSSYRSSGWGHRLFGGIRAFLWLLVLSALVILLVQGRRRTEAESARRSKTLKPEGVKS